jgi:hypothetical protein
MRFQMPQRQSVVTRQGEITQPRQTEGQCDLIAAGRRESRLELRRIDPNERADEDDCRNGNDQQTERYAEAPQQRPARLDRRDPSGDAVRIDVWPPAIGPLVGGRALPSLLRHSRPLSLLGRRPIGCARVPGKRR